MRDPTPILEGIWRQELIHSLVNGSIPLAIKYMRRCRCPRSTEHRLENTVLVLGSHSLSDRIRGFNLGRSSRHLLIQMFQQQIKQCNGNKQSYNLRHNSGVKTIYRFLPMTWCCSLQTSSQACCEFFAAITSKMFMTTQSGALLI